MEEPNMKIYTYNGKRNICGSKIKETRNLRKLSQAELAARLQIESVILERDSISRIENGARFVSDFELLILAKTLRVDPKWLLCEPDMKTE